MSASPTSPLAYLEVQRVRMVWVWVLVTIAAVIAWTQPVSLLVADEDDTTTAKVVVGLLVWLFAGIALPLFVWKAQLRIEVSDGGVHAKWVWLQPRGIRVDFADIVSAEAVSYHPIRDWGGWGIRFRRGGRAYNAYGNRGVELRLTDGRMLLLGSQRADELEAVIRNRTGPAESS